DAVSHALAPGVARPMRERFLRDLDAVATQCRMENELEKEVADQSRDWVAVLRRLDEVWLATILGQRDAQKRLKGPLKLTSKGPAALAEHLRWATESLMPAVIA